MQTRGILHCSYGPAALRLAFAKPARFQSRAVPANALISQNLYSSCLVQGTSLPHNMAYRAHRTTFAAMPCAHTAHKLDGLTADEACVGVKLSSAVMHSLYAAKDALDVLPQQPSYITDTPRLFIACLSHPDCSELCASLERQGIIIEEVKAVLQAGIGRSMRVLEANEQPDPCNSPLTKRVMQCAMQYAVRQGRDIVELKDVLCTLTSNRDVISITSNPLYFALDYMCGPFEVDKVMDTWSELLQSTAFLLAEESDGVLPPYIPPGACELLRSGIQASTDPSSLQVILETYDEIGWAPSITVCQAVWDKLLACKDWGPIDSFTAEQLLSALSSLAMPSTSMEKAFSMAELLSTIFMCTDEAEKMLEGDTTGNISSSAVVPLLECMARFKEAFPFVATEDKGEGGMGLAINGSCVFHISRRGLDKVVNEYVPSKSVKAYSVMKSIACLKAGTSFDSMLPYHLRQYTPSTACIDAACLTEELRFYDLNGDSHLQIPHVLISERYAQVKNVLPTHVWVHVLSFTAQDGNHNELMQHLHWQWGYIWEGADYTVLANRLATLAAMSSGTDEKFGAYSSLISEWLWDDVRKLLPAASDINAAQSIVWDASIALNAPTPDTAARLSKVLQQVLRGAQPNNTVMPLYMSLTAQYVEWAAASAHQEAYSNDSDAIPVVRLDQDSCLNNAGLSQSEAHITLEDVHMRLATMFCSSWSKSEAKSLSKRSAFEALLEPKPHHTDNLDKLKSVFASNQITTLEAISWACMDLKAERYPSTDYLQRWAYTVSTLFVKDQTTTSSRQPSCPAVLRRWLPILRQRVSLGLEDTNDKEKACDVMRLVIPNLATLQQPGLWLGNTPRDALNVANYDYKSTGLVWALSLTWSKIPPPRALRLTDNQLSNLTKDLGAGKQPKLIYPKRVLDFAAAACQFSECLSSEDDDAPFIFRQLLLVTCQGLLSQINAMIQNTDSSYHVTKWDVEDLLMLSYLTQRLASGVMPVAISKDEVTSALRVLVSELERRMSDNHRIDSDTAGIRKRKHKRKHKKSRRTAGGNDSGTVASPAS